MTGWIWGLVPFQIIGNNLVNSCLNTSCNFYLEATSHTNLFQLQNGQLIDIHVIVQGEVFQAHKILLCSASKFLMDRILNLSLSLYPGLRHDLLCLILDNCTSGQFRYILDYIYEGKVDIPEHVCNFLILHSTQCGNLKFFAISRVNCDFDIGL